MDRYHGTVGPKFSLYIVLEHEQNFSEMLFIYMNLGLDLYFCTLLNTASPAAPQISLCQRMLCLNHTGCSLLIPPPPPSSKLSKGR
jgi:hypothetical protein